MFWRYLFLDVSFGRFSFTKESESDQRFEDMQNQISKLDKKIMDVTNIFLCSDVKIISS